MSAEYFCLFCGSPISEAGVDIYKEEEYYVCQDCTIDYTFVNGHEIIHVTRIENEEEE